MAGIAKFSELVQDIQAKMLAIVGVTFGVFILPPPELRDRQN